METAKLLLGEGKELNAFVSRLLDDIGKLKAMLHAISIGAQCTRHPPHALTICASTPSMPPYHCVGKLLLACSYHGPYDFGKRSDGKRS